ncbi:MAG: hypothetical protein JW971_04310 [Synergistales bacterium]|nr:hypothetical protein [Synergistales bacterium]
MEGRVPDVIALSYEYAQAPRLALTCREAACITFHDTPKAYGSFEIL